MFENILIFTLGALIASACFCGFFSCEFTKISRQWGKISAEWEKIRQGWLNLAAAQKERK